MNNLEIDRKLAEKLGYTDIEVMYDNSPYPIIGACSPKDGYWTEWNPTGNMKDAWEVFNFFKLDELYRSLNIWVAMRYENDAHPIVNAQSDESAEKAICLAALKVIENQEGSKSDE
ncbi:BC1872 family protein [Sporolactobacillus laevolacticus]|uniref:Phage ABA sandwich domain-containing protein n=1 Tax=Sporolactobacillus laevolacticus DSM 442 TaxID=1395513 RepID=V6IY13_9BACL|nr:hypothetical protein [Sporolactobacillus laevolacticus]EST12230.1 hypothetical protein P343_08100 [Sporolactobacillus laevolacticus DSM 442]